MRFEYQTTFVHVSYKEEESGPGYSRKNILHGFRLLNH
jgi:hypothetical protein